MFVNISLFLRLQEVATLHIIATIFIDPAVFPFYLHLIFYPSSYTLFWFRLVKILARTGEAGCRTSMRKRKFSDPGTR